MASITSNSLEDLAIAIPKLCRHFWRFSITTGIAPLVVSQLKALSQLCVCTWIYASQNRALTANDYETLIPAKIYPETESISVFGGEELVPPQYGKVFISIKPRAHDFLPNLMKENIKSKFEEIFCCWIVPEIQI